MPYIEGQGVFVGSRKGYVLAIEEGYLWVVYTHRLINGQLKPYDNTKIYQIKEDLNEKAV